MIWLVFETFSMFFAYFCLIKISKRIVVKKRETLGLNKCFFCFCFVFFEKKKKKIHVRWAHEYIIHRGSWCWHIQKTFDEIRNNHILKFEKNKTQKSRMAPKNTMADFVHILHEDLISFPGHSTEKRTQPHHHQTKYNSLTTSNTF